MEEKILHIDEEPSINIDSLPSKGKILNKKIIITAIIAFICIITSVVIYAVKDWQYKSSDEYKISLATQLIIDKEYSNALKTIQSIDNREAEALRQYVTVLEKRDAVIDGFKTDALAEDSIDYDNFTAALNEFTELNIYYYLPERLMKQYEYYNSSIEYISEGSVRFYDNLTEAQKILLNEPRRKSGEGYDSIYTLETDILNSTFAGINLAYTKLDFVYDDHCQFFFECFDALRATIDQATKDEENLKNEYKNAGRKYGEKVYPEEYIKNPEIFSHYINSHLESVDDNNDIEKNAEKLTNTYKKAYLISEIKKERGFN